jgi:hypothetical protein
MRRFKQGICLEKFALQPQTGNTKAGGDRESCRGDTLSGNLSSQSATFRFIQIKSFNACGISLAPSPF